MYQTNQEGFFSDNVVNGPAYSYWYDSRNMYQQSSPISQTSKNSYCSQDFNNSLNQSISNCTDSYNFYYSNYTPCNQSINATSATNSEASDNSFSPVNYQQSANNYNWNYYYSNYWAQSKNPNISSYAYNNSINTSFNENNVTRDLNNSNDQKAQFKKEENIQNEFNKNILPLLLNDEDNKRKGRTAITTDQRHYLLALFEQNCYPTKEVLETAANKLRVSTQTIQTWFKNTRSKRKKLTNTKYL